MEEGQAEEDHFETIQIIRDEFKEEKEKLVDNAQNILSKNRNTNISSQCL